MFPIKDNVPSKRWPLINTLLIILNVVAFYYQTSLDVDMNTFFQQYGVVPEKFQQNLGEISYPSLGLSKVFFPLITSAFLHGSLLHLLSNVWILWIFGDNVEDRLGHLGYLGFYLLAAVGAGLIHVITNIDSDIPAVGASGAIAGVMGAYFILFPRAKVLTLVVIFFLIQLIWIPAYIYLGVWILIQFYYGTVDLAINASVGGVAWWAHIGGFLVGLLFAFLIKR